MMSTVEDFLTQRHDLNALRMLVYWNWSSRRGHPNQTINGQNTVETMVRSAS